MIIQKRRSVKRFFNCHTAFTLAEVLITLGIIGVVAAITIPVLMQNIQDKQFKEAAKTAYSKASQAVQLMKDDNGGTLVNFNTTTKSFKKDFSANFKVAQDCIWNNCVAGSYTLYKELSGGQASTNWMGNGQFITADGVFWGIFNNAESGTTRIMITVDVNGYTKGPNVFGRDTFMFELYNDTFKPMGATGTYFSAQTYCQPTEYNNYFQGMGCMEYVMDGTSY